MSKYNYLISILDKIRNEAPPEYKRYHDLSNEEKINDSRAKALIHLFFKVNFGLINFLEREKFITDGPDDGGIDGYFIDTENKKLYFIQSKFRANENNFENKEIMLNEILSMDVDRITKGETTSKNGVKYSSKILHFIKELQSISDLPKYDYKVIILANVKESLKSKINKITGGFHSEIYNFERCYNELVFPLIAGTFYNVSELKISINIGDNSYGHRIDHYVKTNSYDCNVNAFFVPTIEIAQIVSKYKNSILVFNPRSYLDLATGSINLEIAKSITHLTTNEFAIFNNGITMLSNKTGYSDKVGKRNKAEVMVTNPQIINGGQTAFTLSKIYEDCLKERKTLEIFDNKEVLLKIITISDDVNNLNGNKLQLIEEISKATNQQTPVTEADRRSNDKVQVELQKVIYEEFGFFYERKKGEFLDGINNNYISNSSILNRETFFRVTLAAQNKPTEAAMGRSRLFEKSKFDSTLPNILHYKKYVFAYLTLKKLETIKSDLVGNALTLGKYAVVTVVSNFFNSNIKTQDFDSIIERELKDVLNKWTSFESFARNQKYNNLYFRESYDKLTGEKIVEAKWFGYYKGVTLIADLISFFKIGNN